MVPEVSFLLGCGHLTLHQRDKTCVRRGRAKKEDGCGEMQHDFAAEVESGSTALMTYLAWPLLTL